MDSSSSTPARGKKRASRVALSDDESNVGSAVKSKGKGKMVKRARSASAEEEEEEEEEEDQLGSDGDEEETPAKRQKVKMEAKGKGKANGNGNGNGNANGNGSGEESEEEEGIAIPAGVRPEYQRGSDGYVAGSIVRMKLINFMTYDHVEFRPGPHLNFILGPNGTGKSSIAAAIAIGLAFKPQVMGRSDNYQAYVNQSCDTAHVEIELKAYPGKRNPVIGVKLTREKNGAEFKLNNAPSTKRAIQEMVADFGVGADNLCSFLPQDKVAEFAKMKPTEVLKETMSAAGDVRLQNWFKDLVKHDANRYSLETRLEATKNERDSTQNQVNTLAPDVQHFEERESLLKQERILAPLWAAAKRCELLRDVQRYRKKKADLKKEMAKRVSRSQPITNLQALTQKKVDKSKERLRKAEQLLRDTDKDMALIWRRLDRKSDSINEINRELNAIKKTVEREKKARDGLLARRKEAQDILDKPIEDVAAQLAEATEARKQASIDFQKAKKDYEDISQKYLETTQRMSDLTKQTDIKTKQLDRLSSINNHKEDMAKMADATMRYVLEWMPQHEADFEEKIHKPAQISVNLKDRRFASQVESGVGWNARCTFIVTTARDYERLLALNRHKHGPGQTKSTWGGPKPHGPGSVKPHIAQVTVDESSLNPRKPCDRETLHKLGFDGWASDYVEAEPAVIAFLNERCGLSRLAVTRGNGENISADANERAGIRQWATASEHVTVGRSKYGRKDTYEKSDKMKPASSFNVAVDTEGVKKLQDELIALKRAKRDIDQPAEDLRLAQVDAREVVSNAESEVKQLDKTIDGYRKQNAHRINAASTVRKVDQELANLKTTDVEAKKASLKARQKTNLSDRLIIINEAHALQEQYLKIATALGKRKLDLIQLTADLKAIDAKIKATAADISDLEAGIIECTTQIKACTANSVIFSQQFSSKYRDLSEEEQAELSARLPEVEAPADDLTAEPQTTAEQIGADYQVIKANLSLSIGIDRSVVDKYKRLVAQLEVLIKEADNQGTEFKKVRKHINEVMKVFDPALNDLVAVVSEKFGKAFDRVGCTGEVRIDRNAEGYDKWGIQILVSYRNGDNLQLLTGSRQSGGERSLATVTYLMSLASMSRTPFSLVDEINQGMDPRVERNVHNQLVGVTCDEDAGQYFLITPKLLPDLMYHPKMKILNVNNGTWLPGPNTNEAKWTQFSSCIKRYRAANGMA